MNQDRAQKIIVDAKATAGCGPWSDQLDKVMSGEEQQYVRDVWATMSGNTTFVDAIQRIAEGNGPFAQPVFSIGGSNPTKTGYVLRSAEKDWLEPNRAFAYVGGKWYKSKTWGGIYTPVETVPPDVAAILGRLGVA